jgi:hypothetical protein
MTTDPNDEITFSYLQASPVDSSAKTMKLKRIPIQKETIAMTPTVPEIILVPNSTLPSNDHNMAVYDPNKNVLVVGIDPIYNAFRLNMDQFVNHCIENGELRVPAGYIGFAEGDPSKITTCHWYVPSTLKDSSELPSDWPYADAPINGLCRNPQVAQRGKFDRSTPCRADNDFQVSCDIYQEVIPTRIVRMETADGHFAEIRKSWKSPARIPEFHLVTDEGVETFKTMDSVISAYTKIKTDAEKRTSITESNPTPEHQKYFETVLS